jgi:hypothetical protein
MDRAIRQMLNQSLPRPQFFSRSRRFEAGTPNRVCSVPLLEPPLRKDIDFTMKTLQPDAAIAAGPFDAVRPPAPACTDAAPPFFKR